MDRKYILLLKNISEEQRKAAFLFEAPSNGYKWLLKVKIEFLKFDLFNDV